MILLNKKKNLLEGRSLTIFANVQHIIPIAKDISRLISSSLSLSLNWHWTRVSKSEQNRWQTSSLSQDYQVTGQLSKTTFYVCQECFQESHWMILPPAPLLGWLHWQQSCNSKTWLCISTIMWYFHNALVFIKIFHYFIDTWNTNFFKEYHVSQFFHPVTSRIVDHTHLDIQSLSLYKNETAFDGVFVVVWSIKANGLLMDILSEPHMPCKVITNINTWSYFYEREGALWTAIRHKQLGSESWFQESWH